MASKIEQLKELTQLRENGDISVEEYEILKKEILSGNQNQETPIQSVLISYRRKIGEGGQGSVYKGRHQLEAKAKQQGGDVAIKSYTSAIKMPF